MFCLKSADVSIKEVRCFCFPKKALIHLLMVSGYGVVSHAEQVTFRFGVIFRRKLTDLQFVLLRYVFSLREYAVAGFCKVLVAAPKDVPQLVVAERWTHLQLSVTFILVIRAGLPRMRLRL